MTSVYVAWRRACHTQAWLWLLVLATGGCQWVLGLDDHQLGATDSGTQEQTALNGGTRATTGTGGVPTAGGVSGAGGESVAGGSTPFGGTPSGTVAVGGSSHAQGGGSGTRADVPSGGAAGGTKASGGTTNGSGGNGGFDADSGLVAHFSFDESTGTVATNLKDNNKNGSYVGSCTHPAGHLGGAVGLRNSNVTTTGSSEWIELPAGLLSNLSATTVSLWVRDLSTSRSGGRLLDFSSGTAEEIYFAPDEVNATTSLAGGHLGGTHAGAKFVDLWTSSAVFTDKNWHHVAFAWSAASIELYIDGSLSGSKTSPGVLPSALGATTPDWLGRTLNDAFLALYAEIDDLRIYDRALTANEIAQIHSMP